jgi:hypothetical protein
VQPLKLHPDAPPDDSAIPSAKPAAPSGTRAAAATVQPPALEPLAVGREQGAALFSISRATWDRWDAGGQLGPVGIRKNGRKLWLLSELRKWAAAGMPCRKEWLAIRQASESGDRRLQGGGGTVAGQGCRP